MKNKIVYNILIALCIGVMAFSGYKIFQIQSSYKQGDEVYESLNEYIAISDEPKNIADVEVSDTETDKIQEQNEQPEVNFEELKKLNPDVVAWVYFEDSKINYPIVKGVDNDYYLNHMVNGQKNGAGSIFMDMRNQANFSDIHSIIYGHHMKNGSMFSDITKYKNQDYYNKHKTATIITPEGNYELELFSGYVTNVYDNSWELNLKTGVEWKKWAEESKRKSDFKSDINFSENDKYITLSTCSYEFNDARYVLVGKIKK